MKHIKTLVGFMGLLSLCYNSLQAQDLDVITKEKMDFVFEHVDKSKVETGLLSDYGCLLVEPYAYDGVLTDTNYVNLRIWKSLYLSMYTTRINSNATLQEPQRVFNNLRNDAPALLCLQYNRLDKNAVNKGLLKFENDQLWETGNPGSIYLKKDLFAVALPDINTYYSQVSFTFRQENFINNLQEMPVQMAIRFTPSSGYQSVIWGQPINYTYTSYGEKEISFRIRFNNGKVLESHAYIQVVQKPIQHVNEKENEPDEILSIAKTNDHSGGEIQIKYAKFNTTGKLIRPLIIADESDVYNLLQGDDVNLEYLLKKIDEIKEINKLYDLVYINNNNGFDDIFRNAQLFEDAIEQINGKRSDVHDKNYVVGLGMGGLVARYALKDMENKGKVHDVCKFISVNAPHKGLNLPLGLQALIRHIQDIKLAKIFVKDISKEAKELGALLNKTAMKQMLTYSIDENFNYRTDHATFMQRYEAMGMPTQCENAAISNASYSGFNLFQPGERMFEFHKKFITTEGIFILNLIMLGKAELNLDATANSLKSKQGTQVYYGNLYLHKKIIFWSVNINFNKKTLNSTNNMVALDGAPGSIISVKEFFNTNEEVSSAFKKSSFCFVPTASALGINDWENKLLLPLSLNSISSNFNRLYATEGNNGYENLAACKDALLEELASHIEGQTKDNIMGDTEFELTNIPALTIMGIPVPLQSVISWEFSDTNFKVVSSTDNKVVVRPLNFNKQSTLYACLDLSKVGGGKLRIDSIQISSGECKLLGERVLHLNGSRFELSFVPEDATVEWSYSAGIEEKEKGRDYIVLGGSGNSILLWVEAEMKLGDDTQTFYADLTCEPLPEILGVEIDKTRWDRGNGEVWYLLKLKHNPCLKNFETITWKADSLSAGGKAATLYSGLFRPMIFPFATKQSAGDINFPPLKPILPDEPDLTKPWYQRGTGHGEVAIAFGPSCTDTKVTFELNVGGRVQTITRIVSPNGTIRTQNCPQQLKIKAVDAYVSNSGGVWFLLRADYDLMNTATVSFDWNEEYPFVFGLGSLTRDIPNTGSLPFNASGLGGGFEPGQDFGLPWYMKSPNYNEIFLFFRRSLKTSDLTVVNCKMQTDCGVLTASLKVASPIKYNIYDIFPNPVKTNLSVRKIENETEITTKTDSEANADPEIVTLSLFGLSMPEEPEAITIQLYSEYGLVRTLENVILNPDAQMNVADLPNGTYYLNIIKDGEVIDRRVVLIEH